MWTWEVPLERAGSAGTAKTDGRMTGQLELLATVEGVHQGTAVDVLQLTTERNTVGDAADGDAQSARPLADEMGGGLPFDGQVGGQNHFRHLALAQPLQQLVDAQLVGTDAVDG